MRKVAPLLVGLLLCQTVGGALLFYDPFPTSVYTNGTLIGSGSIGKWTLGNTAGAGSSVVSDTAALSYSGLVTSNGSFGLLRPANATTSNRHAGASLGANQTLGAANPTVYCSFLLNVQAAPSANRCVAALSTGTSLAIGAAVWVDSSGRLLVSKNSTTPASGVSPALGAGTHFVVFRYKYNAGLADDEVALWLDPSPSTFGAAETNLPAASVSTTANSDITTIAAVFAVQGQGSGGSGTVYGSGSGALWMDEVRVGTLWADVTPLGEYTPPPPPATNVPVFTRAIPATDALVVQGTNGTPGVDCELLASSDLTLPLDLWPVVARGRFDPSGNFSFTNFITPGVSQRFFRLRVVGPSATNGAPVIISQPQNQVAPIGGSALFSVTATGSPPLYYQWYFNTNMPIAGATNSTHYISSVTSNDAGGYSVRVWNSAGWTNSIVATLTIAQPPTNGNYFVSTTGNDFNPGTMAQPFATVVKAIAMAAPGDVIYVRGGTYNHSSTITIAKSGTSNAPIQLLAYPGEKPVFNFSSQPYGSANRGFLITTNANWWVFKGLEICYAGDNAVKVEGSHHRFEQCVFHHNGDTGLQIGFGHDDYNPDGQLAAFIEVINCDSYLNYDPDSNGGDADGFAAKMHCGRGIVFIGCRAWENSDDGWDLFETDYSIVISNCWTWKSGVGQGNGNGFKLGGNGTGGYSKGTHYAYNCVAFGHKVNGFTQNSHKDGLVIQHCLSFSNGVSGYNYFMEGSLNPGKTNVFKNNVGLPRTVSGSNNFIEDNNPIQLNNSWNLSVTANVADYADLTETAAKAPRQPDGSLPTGFARLVAGSDLIDKGVNVGLPFNGAAPDLGPYEYAP